MAGGSKQRGRSVTSKVLAILSAFEHSRGSMSLTQIADQADLPLSTAYRL
ncbi:IclR family transcriptional regulator, partial [Staphylococcus aureus]